MASIINAATSGGLITTADTSGILQLQTAGTTAVTVDASQNVGVGTASPTKKLDILSNTSQDGIRISGSANPRLTIIDTTTPVQFDALCTDTEAVLRTDTNHPLVFSTNGTERARLNTTGAFVLAGGTTTANGIGITFPATQSASSNANTLDDYEEGTWTPTASPASGALTSYTSSGVYTKVGRAVYVTGNVYITNAGTASGAMTVGGLPFTTINSTSRPAIPICREDQSTGVIYSGFVSFNNTTVTLTSLTGGSVVWSANYNYSFCFTYQTA